MIPTRSSDLPGLVEEVERQTSEVRSIFEGLSADTLGWQPSPQKWSVVGHMVYWGIVNGHYVGAMRECAARARARSELSDGPYKHPWFGRWFAGRMEPPPKRRIGTFKKLIPDPAADAGDALADFERLQGELAELLQSASGIDLGRARFSSPYARIMRFSLGAGFGLVLAHNRRHIWLTREVMDREGFPGS